MNNLQSEIGHTLDLIREEKDGSKRMKLQRYLRNLINCEDKCEVILNPHPIDWPIPYEIEILGWSLERFNLEYPFHGRKELYI